MLRLLLIIVLGAFLFAGAASCSTKNVGADRPEYTE
jgi:hypothetical protein